MRPRLAWFFSETLERLGRILSACVLACSISIFKLSMRIREGFCRSRDPEIRQLLKYGYVVKENFLDPESCDRIVRDVNGLYERYPRHDEQESVVHKLKSGTHIHHRCNFDGIEWYENRNTDFKKIDGEFPYIRKILEKQEILDKIRPFYGRSLPEISCRVYRSENSDKTRDFHCDGTDFSQYKIFIYLTDVDLSAGPYTYISQSHRSPFWILKNLFYNAIHKYEHNDCRIHPNQGIRHFLAAKGTLIITNQSGLHRGWPQQREGTRFLLVGMVSAKRSFLNEMLYQAARRIVILFDSMSDRIYPKKYPNPLPYRRGWIDNRRSVYADRA